MNYESQQRLLTSPDDVGTPFRRFLLLKCIQISGLGKYLF
jgi:hypothetical protein